MQPLTKIILAKLRKAHSTDLFHSNHSAHKTQKNMTYPFAKKKEECYCILFHYQEPASICKSTRNRLGPGSVVAVIRTCSRRNSNRLQQNRLYIIDCFRTAILHHNSIGLFNPKTAHFSGEYYFQKGCLGLGLTFVFVTLGLCSILVVEGEGGYNTKHHPPNLLFGGHAMTPSRYINPRSLRTKIILL